MVGVQESGRNLRLERSEGRGWMVGVESLLKENVPTRTTVKQRSGSREVWDGQEPGQNFYFASNCDGGRRSNVVGGRWSKVGVKGSDRECDRTSKTFRTISDDGWQEVIGS